MLAPEGGHVDPAEIAFLTLEPIQGVGGYRFPSEAFMDEVAAVTDEYDIPLVVDEIQSGVGRTGEMWAADHYAIEPDVIASAKALRVGATISRSEMFPTEKNRLGSTFGGGDLLGSMMGRSRCRRSTSTTCWPTRPGGVGRPKRFFVTTRPTPSWTFAVGPDARGGVRHARASLRRRRGVPRPGTVDARLRDKDDPTPSPLDATEREIALGTGIFLDAIDAVSASAAAT